MKLRFSWILFFLAISHGASAYESFPVAGSRSKSMGNTTSCFRDVWAANNNQAGLSNLKSPSAGLFVDNKWGLSELSRVNFSFAYPTGSGVFGLNVNHSGFSLYNEQKLGIAYSKSLGETFSYGFAINYQGINIPDYGNRRTATVEAGILSQINKYLLLGFHITNLNRAELSGYGTEKIPSTMKLGICYEVSEQLLLTAETKKDLKNPIRAGAGLEYRYNKTFELRGGISPSPFSGSFGFGIKNGHMKLDAATVYHSRLGFSPNLSIVFELSK